MAGPRTALPIGHTYNVFRHIFLRMRRNHGEILLARHAFAGIVAATCGWPNGSAAL